MRIVEQSISLLREPNYVDILENIEEAARNCYKSEGKNPEKDPAKRDSLIRATVARRHTSVLEHSSFTFRVICDRGISHQWVRHRIGWSYSQESTRFCNYGDDRFGSEITVIWPTKLLGPMPDTSNGVDGMIFNSRAAEVWLKAMRWAEVSYIELLKQGWKAEDARDVLPTALKTEIVCTANIVSLRHFFEERCAADAHHKIRGLAGELLYTLSGKIPIVFDDLREKFIG
jgi:thymidylate synthase (FAD)